MFDKYVRLNNFPFFLLLVSIALFAAYIQQVYVVIPSLSAIDLPDEIRQKYIDAFMKYRWLGFVVQPFWMLLRIALVALCIFVRMFLENDSESIAYQSCFNITLKTDIIFAISSIVTCFVLICTGISQDQLAEYSSLLCLVNTKTIDKWAMVPLSAVNLTEVIYCFFIAKLFSVETKKGYWKSLGYVLSGYGVGYLFMIIFLMFLVLYFV